MYILHEYIRIFSVIREIEKSNKNEFLQIKYNFYKNKVSKKYKRTL